MSAADQAKGPSAAFPLTLWLNVYPDGQIGKTLCSSRDEAIDRSSLKDNSIEAKQVEVVIMPKEAAQPLAAALRKLADRVDMVNRGVAEGVELIGLVAEARDALRGWGSR